MYPITTDTAVDGEFTDGDESQGIPPTDLNALWFNTIQRELLNVLANLGINPNAADFGQIWDSLKRVGLKTRYSDSDVGTSVFDGSSVVFHDAADFDLGSLKTNSLVIIIPFWASNSPDFITVGYNNDNFKIYKYRIFVGIALNATVDELQIAGVYLPVMSNEGRDLPVRNLTATLLQATSAVIGSLQYSRRIDTGLVEITTADTTSWMLKANWSLGQVKRVYCSDATAAGVEVAGYLPSGGWNDFKFYPGRYREFICIGFYTTSQTQTEFAVLLVNGSDGEF
jgi:hypothetical protein